MEHSQNEEKSDGRAKHGTYTRVADAGLASIFLIARVGRDSREGVEHLTGLVHEGTCVVIIQPVLYRYDRNGNAAYGAGERDIYSIS